MLRYITRQCDLVDFDDVNVSAWPDDIVYLDLFHPKKDEELRAEKWLGHTLPTREEMLEIEESSRLYVERGVLYMTASVPVGLETSAPDTAAVSFVISERALVVVRYDNPLPFRQIQDQVRRLCPAPLTTDAVFFLLMERVVGRVADALQNVEAELKKVSRNIFSIDPNKADGGGTQCDLNEVVKLLGRSNNLVASLRESLVTVSRMMQFFIHNAGTWMNGEVANQFRSIMRDVKSLDDYASQQTQQMNFLLDSSLGLINIQQNQIMKIFTMLSVIFMPPTLIAGIYGMNFKHMPELEEPAAYPLTWAAMILCAVLPVFYFKWKKML